MGTTPPDPALGEQTATGVPPEEEVGFGAALSLGSCRPERTGPLLEEEEEEDGSGGREPRTRPAAEPPPGSREEEEEEELSTAAIAWHAGGCLGEREENPGGPTAAGEAGLAEQEEEERSQSGVEPRLPSGEEAEEMERACLLGSKALSPGWAAQGAPGRPEGGERECPICTELYDREHRRPASLNCSHVLCSRCLRAILQAGSAADIGRVRCPICRQKTPMMEWEICKLQEELLLLSAAQGPAPPAFCPVPPRRPGFWGGLEHRFHVRFHTSRVVGFLPCLRYPTCLVNGLAGLERRCPWCHRAALLALAAAEVLSLLLVFLPLLLLLLLFLILDK